MSNKEKIMQICENLEELMCAIDNKIDYYRFPTLYGSESEDERVHKLVGLQLIKDKILPLYEFFKEVGELL